jgi:hypothetical protein
VVTLAPGVHDIPEADYFAATDALSCSGAKLLLPPNCPALFRWRQDHPEHKDVFDFGSAAHKMVLGAGPKIALVDAPDWRSKAAKEAKAEAYADGATPLLLADFSRVQAMAEAILRHPVANALVGPGRGNAERSLFWVDEDTGVHRRCRVDQLPNPGPGRYVVTDYKTCAKADPASIAKAVANFGYAMQDAWYLDGATALGLADDPAFVFIFQEKEPPYLVTVVQLDDEARAVGRERNRIAIERFRDCTEAGHWPGYSEDIEQIALPPWAARTEVYA